MEKNMKGQLIKSVNSIKNKLKQMKNEEATTNTNLHRIFKPLTVPLTEIKKHLDNKNISQDNKRAYIDNSHMDDSLELSMKTSTSRDSLYEDIQSDSNDSFSNKNEREILSKKHDITPNSKFWSMMVAENVLDDNNSLNIPFGLRSENDQLYLGKVPITIRGSSNKLHDFIISFNNKKYEISSGLKELLLKKKPDIHLITDIDRQNYKDILLETNAHKRDFKSMGQIKGDKSMKYCQIIKPLFSESNDLTEKNVIKKGGNMKFLKKSYNKNTDLIYWDDPNELIERLMLLVASKNAGNNNHDNEIISIIEELKEAEIIKE